MNARAIIDTGARPNIIGTSAIDKLNLRVTEPSPGYGIRVADGKVVPVTGRTSFKIDIGNNSYPITCDVVDSFPYDVLLGNEFLFSIDMQLFTGRNELWIDDNRFKINNKCSETEGKALRTRKRTHLQPNETAILCVEGRVKDRELFLIEGSHGAEAKGLIVTRSINYAKTRRMVIGVKNETSRIITLPKGVVIAEATRIDDPDNDCLMITPDDLQSRPTDGRKSEQAPRNHASLVTSGPKDKPASCRACEKEGKKKCSENHPERNRPNKNVHLTDKEYKESRQFDLSNLDMGSDLTEKQKADLKRLLHKFNKVMSKHETDTGRTHLVEHDIVTDGPPVHQRPYRLSFAERKALTRLIQEYIEAGYIRESDSPYACPIVLVKKKDGTMRFCCDWRKVNQITRKDAMPLPRIDDMIDRFSKAKFFTKIDFTSGYYQVPLKESAIEKTAFVTPDGHYEWLVMGMGLTNAPATFQRLMYKVLGDMLWKNAMAYMDDLVIFSPTYEQHMKDLSDVLTKVQAAGLKIKPPKCSFAMKGIQYLGFIISEKGVECDPATTEKVKQFAVPQDIRDVRRFLGLTSYYRKFIHRYAFIAKPLYELLKDNVKFKWTEAEQKAFNELRDKLTSPPVLTYPDLNKPFLVATDASGFGVGAVLKQKDDQNKERVIAYASRVLNKAERNYSTTERECLALKFATQVFRPYLYGTKFTVITDHQSLVYLQSMKNPNGRLARWKMHLLDFEYDVVYKKGKLNTDADTMSRYGMENPVHTPEKDGKKEKTPEKDKVQKEVDRMMAREQKSNEKREKKQKQEASVRSRVSHFTNCQEKDRGSSSGKEKSEKEKNEKRKDVIQLKKQPEAAKYFDTKSPPKQEESRNTVPMKTYQSFAQTLDVNAVDNDSESGSDDSSLSDDDKGELYSDATVSEDNDSDVESMSRAKKESRSKRQTQPSGRKTTIEVAPCDESEHTTKSLQQRKKEKKKSSQVHASRGDGRIHASNQKKNESRRENSCSSSESIHNSKSEEDDGRREHSCREKRDDSPSTHSDESDDEESPPEKESDERKKDRDPTVQLIESEQRKDTGWKSIIDYLENVSSQARASRRVINAAKHYVIKDRILYRRVNHSTGQRLAIVVPSSLIPVTCSNAHDRPITGHLAARRTYYRLKGNYFWTKMWDDVKKFVAGCDKCQKMKDRTQRLKGKMQPIKTSTDPFVEVACDKVGPIQNGRKKYIFIAVDLATRTMIAKATIDGTAKSAAKFFLKNVILAHRPPDKVLTDNGSEFKAEFEQLMKEYHVNHVHSSPRHPRSNGMVERANKTLSQMIRTAVKMDRHTDWEEHVAPSVHAYNTSVHEVTGYSPYYLLRGVHPPAGNLLNEPNSMHFRPGDPTETLLESRKKAVERTEQYQLKQKQRYDQKRGSNDLKKGDFVMMEISSLKKGQSQRFNARRSGPFRVVKVHNNNTADIAGVYKDTARVNIERLSKITIRPDHLLPHMHTIESPPEDENEEIVPDVTENISSEGRSETPADPASPAEEDEQQEDAAVQKLVPLRRSTRVGKPRHRLIETLLATLSERTETQALTDVHRLFE